EIVAALLLAGALALRGNAPGRDGMTAARGLALAAAVRMVDRVHRHAAPRRALALPTVAAGLADLDVLVVRVGHRADRRHAAHRHHAQLARGQPQMGGSRILADELDERAGRACKLPAAADLHLHVVADGAD